MEINHLKEFVVLAQTGNFMEAADILLFFTIGPVKTH